MPERGRNGTASRVWGWLRRRPAVAALARLHRDQQGGLLEYAMVFGFIAVPLLFLFDRLFEVLSDYFSMIAFYASWPFL
jgi:Flp pilus assembly pilin Flp